MEHENIMHPNFKKKKSLLAMRNHTKLYGFILLFLLVSDLDFSLMKKKKKNNNTNENGDKMVEATCTRNEKKPRAYIYIFGVR